MSRNRRARRPQSGRTNRLPFGMENLQDSLAQLPDFRTPYNDLAQPSSTGLQSLPSRLRSSSQQSLFLDSAATRQTRSLSELSRRKRPKKKFKSKTRKPDGFGSLASCSTSTRSKEIRKKKLCTGSMSRNKIRDGMSLEEHEKLEKRISEIKSMLQQRYKGKSSLRGVFLSWDANRDGMVDEHELKDILGMCGCRLTTIEARQICQSFGPEGDTIPYDGFVDLVFEKEETVKSEQERTTKYLRQRLRDLGLTDEQIQCEQERRQQRGLWSLNEVIPRLRERYRKKKSLAKEFREIDVNHDGFVSKDELKSLLARLGYEVPPRDIDDLFLKIDNSGNDTVEYDEFIEVVFPPEQLEPTFIRNQRKSQECCAADAGCDFEEVEIPRSPPPRNIMEHIAQNNDPSYSTVTKVVRVPKKANDPGAEGRCEGTESEEEFQALLSEVSGSVPTLTANPRRNEQPGTRRRFGTRTLEVDLENDGDTRRSSGLRKAIRAAHLRERVGSILRKGFNGNSMAGFHIFDENGDGQISHLEFKRAMGKLKVGLGAADAELLLNYMDRDNSGFVGYDEFCQLIACNHVGTLSTQDLRTIEDAHVAQKATNADASSVDNIGFVNRSASAVTLNLAKKTRLQRRLFPTQHIRPQTAGGKPLQDPFGKLRKSQSQGAFHISHLVQSTDLSLANQRATSRPSTAKVELIGSHDDASERDEAAALESRRYGGGISSAYHNQPTQLKARQRRQHAVAIKKKNFHRHLGESPADAFTDHIRTNERRLRTIIRQRLGYYEALQYRMAKDRARSAILI